MSSSTVVDAPPTGVTPQPSNAPALLRLLLVLLLGIAAAAVTNALPVLLVIVALIVMVMVHELGHFMAAKLSNMKVTEYFFGFGPKLWSIRRGETEYGVKAIPAGGYVRIIGMTTAEELDPTDEPRSYRQASFPRRFLVGVAGSAMHFVMALLLCYALLTIVGVPTATSAEVSGLGAFSNAATPAKLAGVKPGDVLVAVNGKRYANPREFVNVIESHVNRAIALEVRRGHQLVTLHVTPVDGRKVLIGSGKSAVPAKPTNGPAVGVIGVELTYQVVNTRANALVGVPRSAALLGSLTKATVLGIGQVFSFHSLSSFVHQVATATNRTSASTSSSASSAQFVSIVGAVQIGAQAARQNIAELLLILIGINLFVGLLNLFPMLPLDGGHVMIAVYERIRSRKHKPYHADVTKLMPIAYVFLIALLLLGLGALYLNILHPVTLPKG